jgi:ribonuclease Z
MELLFLGTSSGTPTKERNVSGVAIKKKNTKSWYLVDCGEGTQHQILKTKLSLLHLKAICITHIHGDHCYGLPGILASASMDCRKDTLTIIAPKGIKLFLNNVFETTQLELSFDIDFIEVEQVLEHIIKNDFKISLV